ncbi:tRNA-specific 2-thiouridylase [Flammula alnicola]|nr:tRNA-specific 2-thiouridylase [Flammula alnicola]
MFQLKRLSKTCARRAVHGYFTRAFASESTVNVPRKGEKGIRIGTDKGCEWEKDWEDVQLVCRKLDLPCELIDLSREYWNRVFEPSLRQWEFGVSPNPDVWCNKFVLPPTFWPAILIRTRHYATKSWSNFVTGPRPKLLRPTGLQRALFPIGHLTKPEVRQLAKQHGLSTAERPDSVGICFVGEKTKFNNFLSSYIPPNPGPIVNKLTGKVVGEHSGLWNFTIGQNARVPGMPEKMFVAAKDIESNTIYLVPGSTHESLFSRVLHVKDFTWIWRDASPAGIDLPEGCRLYLMHRYRMDPVPCTVRRTKDNELNIACDQPQHAITPGQVAALWDDDWCLGSGVISAAS